MKPQSLLLKAEYVPHFIQPVTRRRVLLSYRDLHRNLSKLKYDDVMKTHLKWLAQYNFAAYKFLSCPGKITALLDYADSHELQWATFAAQGEPKDLMRVLHLAVSTYKVQESPLNRILAKPLRTCDYRSLVYRLNNITKPSIRTFDEHYRLMEEQKSQDIQSIKSPFWQLVRLLRKNNISRGIQKRKLHFWPEDIIGSTVTKFGTPLVPSRQRNTLLKLYEKFLRDAIPPVHPEALDHVRKMSRDYTLTRNIRRRYEDLANHLYTLDENNSIRVVDPYRYDLSQ